jgi:hypothetical protein
MPGCGSSAKPGTSSSSHAPSTSQTSASTSTSPTTTTVTSTEASVVVSGSAGGVTASMHPSSHHPRVKVPWPISFTVTRGGRAARASVSYAYLFGGQVVARRSHYTFTGRFSDVFHWPASAVGYPLTFRAVISSDGVTINLDYPVRVVA